MELHISNDIVTALTRIERSIATLPRSADHASFYKKQARDTQVTDVITLGLSMELQIAAEDAKDLLDTPEQRITQAHYKLLRNSLAVIRYSKTLREFSYNTAVLQHENKLLSDGFTDFWEEGKVRAPHETPSYLHDGLRNKTMHPVYQLWTDIRQLLSYPDEKIHPILLAITTSYHLLTSYPFLQFNLQTALLSVYSIIKPSPYWVSGTVSMMQALWKTLQRTDFTFDPSPEHFTTFTEKMIKEYTLQLDIIHDALLHQSSIAPHIRASLNDRQLKILTYFKQHKKLSRKKYATMMDVAIATSFRDLNDLNIKGLIKSVGKGRGTHYVLAQLPTPGELPNHDTDDTIADIKDTEDIYE